MKEIADLERCDAVAEGRPNRDQRKVGSVRQVIFRGGGRKRGRWAPVRALAAELIDGKQRDEKTVGEGDGFAGLGKSTGAGVGGGDGVEGEGVEDEGGREGQLGWQGEG